MRPARFLLAWPALLAGCTTAGVPRRGDGSARVIAIGQQAAGTLQASDPRLNDNSVYQLWRFLGEQGTTVQIDVMSDAFDAFVILQDDNGIELARNDDGGDGLDARLVFTLPRTGHYRIVANTYRQDAYGRYTLRLADLGARGGATGGVRGRITRGQTVTGVLAGNDPRLTDNSAYHAYEFVGRAGVTITIEVISRDFDAYAIIQDRDGAKLEGDDDSGSGTNARLVYTLPYSGTYWILANAYREGQFGRYTLRVY